MMVDPNGEMISKIEHIALVDAILAKKNLGTTIDMAPITIGLGPGFVQAKMCMWLWKRCVDII